MTDPIFRDPRFDALRNAIYHTSRRKFFDSINRIFNFLVIVLGAGVVAKLVEHNSLINSLLELGVVVTATCQLVFDLGSKARDHEFLQRRYYEILAQIEKVENPSSEQIRDWSSKLLLVAGDETLTMRALDAIAYNNALDATAIDDESRRRSRLNVRIWHSLFRHIFAFNSTEFKV